LSTAKVSIVREHIHELDHPEEWSRVLAGALVQAKIRPAGASTFNGRIRQIRTSGFDLVEMSATDHVAKRTPVAADRDGSDFLLLLQLHGSEELTQGKRKVLLMPGDFVVVSPTQPFLAEVTSGFHSLNLRLSPRALGLTSRQVERLNMHRINSTSGLAPIVSALLHHASKTFPLSAPAQPRSTLDAAQHTIALIRDLLRGQLEEHGEDYPYRRPVLDADQLVEMMLERIRDPNLTADDLARDAHISRRQLHRLFEQRNETFSACLRRLRIERAAADLSRTGYADIPVTEISAQWGFTSPTSFSKAFRRQLGMTPTEFRRSIETSRENQLAEVSPR